VSFVGSTIGHIRIESRLGRGGMGEVYLGFDPRLERRVAVKTIRPEQRMSPRVKARFLREARLLSKMGHPSICQVYDLIETPEADFLVLEYVQGKTLRELAADRDQSFEQKLRLGEKIALALAAAHREKIVHRDLKAENVMVTPEGEVKVLDFGIARSLGEPAEPTEPKTVKPVPPTGDSLELTLFGGQPLFELNEAPSAALTRHGMIVGTLHAMSPEQAAGGKVTSASDLYSFGILLQELFTGVPAYEATDERVVFQVMRAETQPVTGLDPDLTRLIQDLESLDPRRRPTADEAATRLRWISDKPQRLRAQRLRLTAVAAAFTVLVFLLAAVSWFAVQANRARREADQRRKQAEGLISFMIGDLRPKLEAANRLDLLDAVGDHALAYFHQIAESEETHEELSHRIEAILQIGEVRRAQGNLPEALKTFREAEALSRRLATRAPALEGQIHLAASYAWIGQVLFEQGNPDAALAVWQDGLRLAQQGLAAKPGDAQLQSALAEAHHNVGTALDVKGDLSGALLSYRECLRLQRRLAAAQPGDRTLQTEVAATLAWVSNSLEQQGDLAGALVLRREHLAIQEHLASLDPRNPVYRQDLAVAQGFLAGLLAVTGDRPAARGLYTKGLAIIGDLAGNDPANTALQRWLAAFHSALGALAQADGDPEAALASLRTTRRILEPLVAKDPTNTDWQGMLASCHSRTAAVLAARDSEGARTEARTALALLSPRLREDPDLGTRALAAETELTLGRIEAARGDRPAARDAWEQALGALAPCPRPLTFWKVLAPSTQALLALGRTDEARPAMERLRAMGYRERWLEPGTGATAPAPAPPPRRATG
jgi:tetratricopeptide (TPR) repeat protein